MTNSCTGHQHLEVCATCGKPMIRDDRWPMTLHDDGSICTLVVPKPELLWEPQRVMNLLLMMQWSIDRDDRVEASIKQKGRSRGRRRK